MKAEEQVDIDPLSNRMTLEIVHQSNAMMSGKGREAIAKNDRRLKVQVVVVRNQGKEAEEDEKGKTISPTARKDPRRGQLLLSIVGIDQGKKAGEDRKRMSP